MRRLLFASLAASSACSAPETTSLELPTEVSWAAVLVPRGDGLTGALEKVGGDHRLTIELPRSSDALEVRGYTDTALSALSESRAVFGVRLSSASACEPALPQPSFLASYEAGRLRGGEDRASLPRVTSAWVKGSCRSHAVPLSLVTGCSSRPCYWPSVDVGCGFTIDASSCGLPTLCGARVEGEAAAVGWEPPAACSITAAGAAGFGPLLSCTIDGKACPVEVRLGEAPNGPPTQFKVRAQAIFPGKSYRASGPLYVGGAVELLTGYLTDLALLGDRLVVLHGGGVLVRPDDCYDMELELLDRDTLMSLGRAAAPRCLQAIVAAPSRRGFLGVATSSTGMIVYRFDAAGTVVDRLAIDSGVAPQRRVIRDPILVGPGAALVGYLDMDDDGRAMGADVVVDFSGSLRTTRALRFANEEFYYTAGDGGTVVGFGDAESSYAVIMDTQADRVLHKIPLPITRSERTGAALYHPLSWVFSTFSTSNALYLAQTETDGARVFFHDGPHSPLGLFTTPSRSRQVVVSLTDLESEALELRLGLVDLGTKQFVRGSQVIGRGVATRFEVEGTVAATKVYALLPWSAEILLLEE